MRCLYCGKELPLLKRLAKGEFCSDDHRQRYQQEYSELALNRLMQAKPSEQPHSQKGGAERANLPLAPKTGIASMLAKASRPLSETTSAAPAVEQAVAATRVAPPPPPPPPKLTPTPKLSPAPIASEEIKSPDAPKLALTPRQARPPAPLPPYDPSAEIKAAEPTVAIAEAPPAVEPAPLAASPPAALQPEPDIAALARSVAEPAAPAGEEQATPELVSAKEPEVRAPAPMAGIVVNYPPAAEQNVTVRAVSMEASFATARPHAPESRVAPRAVELANAERLSSAAIVNVPKTVWRGRSLRLEPREFARPKPVFEFKSAIDGPRIADATQSAAISVTPAASQDETRLWVRGGEEFEALPLQLAGAFALEPAGVEALWNVSKAVPAGALPISRFAPEDSPEPRNLGMDPASPSETPALHGQAGFTEQIPVQQDPKPALAAMPIVFEGSSGGRARPVQVFASTLRAAIAVDVPGYEALPLRSTIIVEQAGGAPESKTKSTASPVRAGEQEPVRSAGPGSAPSSEPAGPWSKPAVRHAAPASSRTARHPAPRDAAPTEETPVAATPNIDLLMREQAAMIWRQAEVNRQQAEVSRQQAEVNRKHAERNLELAAASRNVAEPSAPPAAAERAHVHPKAPDAEPTVAPTERQPEGAVQAKPAVAGTHPPPAIHMAPHAATESKPPATPESQRRTEEMAPAKNAPAGKPSAAETRPAPAASGKTHAVDPKPAVAAPQDAPTSPATPPAQPATPVVIPLTPAAPVAPDNDLGLPQFDFATSDKKLPPWAAIAAAAAVLLAGGGAWLFLGHGNSKTAEVHAATSASGGVGPDWLENFSPDPKSPRTISILRSSQSASDYAVEFNASVDQKALGWVFRATDPENFYVGKIELVNTPAGPAAVFVYFPVIHGLGQERKHSQVMLPATPGTVYHIRLEAYGDRFTAWIQDRKVEEWTDNRLLAGGAGLYSESGERARLQGEFRVVLRAAAK